MSETQASLPSGPRIKKFMLVKKQESPNGMMQFNRVQVEKHGKFIALNDLSLSFPM